MALSVIGLGAGDISQISYGAMELLKSGRPVYLRTEKHPIVDLLINTMIVRKPLKRFMNL